MNFDPNNQMLRRLVGLRLLMNRPLTGADPPISMDDGSAAPDAPYDPWTNEDRLKQLLARRLLAGRPPSVEDMSPSAQGAGAAPWNFRVAASPNPQQPAEGGAAADAPYNPWSTEDQLKQLVARRLLAGRPLSLDDLPTPGSLQISPAAAATSPPTDLGRLMETPSSQPAPDGVEAAPAPAPTAAALAPRGGSSQQTTSPPGNPTEQARLRARAEAYLQDPNVRAFLNTIGYAEGADYNSLYGSPPKTFTDFGKYPGRGLPNTASGKYQILERTYDGLARELGLTDFSPHTQDLMATHLLIENSAMPWVLNRNFDQALANAAWQWGGLPQGPVQLRPLAGIDANPRPGQNPKPYNDVLRRYNAEISR
jgi:muramidase (phage lysozyme)